MSDEKRDDEYIEAVKEVSDEIFRNTERQEPTASSSIPTVRVGLPPSVEIKPQPKFTLEGDKAIEYAKGVLRDNANLVVGQESDEQRATLAETFNRAFQRAMVPAPCVEEVVMGDDDTVHVRLSLPGHHVEDMVFGQLVSKLERHESPEPVAADYDGFSEFYDSVYRQDESPTAGHGWLQWKGTDVCIDLHCECGAHGHFDGYFLYFYRCKCGQLYALGQNVKLIKLNEKQDAFVMRDRPNVVQDVDFDED